MRIFPTLAAPAAILVTVALAACRDTTAPITPVPTLTAQNSAIGLPPGWGGFLGQPASFIVGVESADAHGGTHAAFLTNADSVESGATFADIGQLVRADSYVGHRVRWSGWVRATNVELPLAAGGQVSGLWMRVDGSDSTLKFDNMELDPVVGTSDWHQVSVVLDVPSNAVGIAFGVLFSGTGQLLVDDLAVDIVSASVPTTNLTNGPFSQPNVGATYQNAPIVPTNLDFESSAAAYRGRP